MFAPDEELNLISLIHGMLFCHCIKELQSFTLWNGAGFMALCTAISSTFFWTLHCRMEPLANRDKLGKYLYLCIFVSQFKLLLPVVGSYCVRWPLLLLTVCMVLAWPVPVSDVCGQAHCCSTGKAKAGIVHSVSGCTQ